MIDVRHDRFDDDRAVDASELFGSGDGLGQTRLDVGLVEEHLPLQIAQLDEITVDDPQSADAGPDQRVRQYAPQRPAAEQDRAARH